MFIIFTLMTKNVPKKKILPSRLQAAMCKICSRKQERRQRLPPPEAELLSKVCKHVLHVLVI